MFPPLINDITTTFPNEPRFVETARQNPDLKYDYNPTNFQAQREYYKELNPLDCPLSPEKCFEICHQVARREGAWRIVSVEPNTYRLEAVATTWLFRFEDDLIVEVRTQDQKNQIHMRSKSRKGKGDLGANARRIRDFLAKLRTKFDNP